MEKIKLKAMVKSALNPVPEKEGMAPNLDIAYLSTGVAGQNMTYNLVAGWIKIYCIQVLMISNLMVGTVLGIIRIFDAINDPIIGTFIDRHPFKNGDKLRPYLKFLSPIIGILSMYLFVDFGQRDKFAVAYIVIIYTLWDLLYSFQDVSLWSMTARMSNDAQQRGKIAQWARTGGSIGSLPSGLIQLLIANMALFGFVLSDVFALAGIILGFFGMIIAMMAAKAKERVPIQEKEESVLVLLKDIGRNKIVILLLISSILGSLSLCLDQYFFFQCMVSVNVGKLHLNGDNVNFLFGIVAGIPGFAALFFATKIAKKLGGMLNVLIVASLSNILIRILCFVIGYQGYRIIFVAILLAINSIPNGITGIASTTLWGDSVDNVEWETGRRTEGSSFSLQNLIAKATSGISIFMTSLVLHLVNYSAEDYAAGVPVSEEFIAYSWPLFILGPIMGTVLSLIPIAFLHYSPKRQIQINRELIQRRSGFSPYNEMAIEMSKVESKFFEEQGV